MECCPTETHVSLSEEYSPVLGPALRRATDKYKLDLVLDGEILAWDSDLQETVPFGQNRTVAKLRKAWMKQNGLLEDRDLLLHKNEKEAKTIRTAGSYVSNQSGTPESELTGEECWLEFCAFDVLYIDGPDATKILDETLSPHVQPRPPPGPIINLDGIQRKKLLYKLIDAQEHEVEVV